MREVCDVLSLAMAACRHDVSAIDFCLMRKGNRRGKEREEEGQDRCMIVYELDTGIGMLKGGRVTRMMVSHTTYLCALLEPRQKKSTLPASILARHFMG